MYIYVRCICQPRFVGARRGSLWLLASWVASLGNALKIAAPARPPAPHPKPPTPVTLLTAFFVPAPAFALVGNVL